MAHVCLLVGNEPPRLKKRLEDEVVQVENVIEMEREAINTAPVRYDEVRKQELAERTVARAAKQAPGECRAKGGPRRRS